MRLVVIDDAEVLRSVVELVSRDLGHEVVARAETLSDALAALAALATAGIAVDAILLDGRLPGPGTIAEVVAALVAAATAVPILTIAALDERETLRAACAAGATGGVLRPLSHAGLATALARLDGDGDRPSPP